MLTIFKPSNITIITSILILYTFINLIATYVPIEYIMIATKILFGLVILNLIKFYAVGKAEQIYESFNRFYLDD